MLYTEWSRGLLKEKHLEVGEIKHKLIGLTALTLVLIMMTGGFAHGVESPKIKLEDKVIL